MKLKSAIAAAVCAAAALCPSQVGARSAAPTPAGRAATTVTLRVSPSRIEQTTPRGRAAGPAVSWSGRVTVANPSAAACWVTATATGLAHGLEGLPEARSGSGAAGPPSTVSVEPSGFALPGGQARDLTLRVVRQAEAAYVCLAVSARSPGAPCEVRILVPIILRSYPVGVRSGGGRPGAVVPVRLSNLAAARSAASRSRLELRCEAYNAGIADTRVRVRFTVYSRHLAGDATSSAAGAGAAPRPVACVVTRDTLILPGCGRLVRASVEGGAGLAANTVLAGTMTLRADVLAGDAVVASNETSLGTALAAWGSQG